MISYTTLAADASELLAEYGSSLTRRSYTTGSYDPATGAASTTTADTTRTGVFLGVNGGAQYVRGQLIQGGDKQLLLDASGGLNLQDHIIDASGVEWTIVSIDAIAPAEVTVLFDVHVRI